MGTVLTKPLVLPIYKALRKRKERTDILDDEWLTSRDGCPAMLNEDDISDKEVVWQICQEG